MTFLDRSPASLFALVLAFAVLTPSCSSEDPTGTGGNSTTTSGSTASGGAGGSAPGACEPALSAAWAPGGIAVDDTYFYVATNGQVAQHRKDGAPGGWTVQSDHLGSVLVDGTRVYWATPSGIESVSKQGGTPSLFTATPGIPVRLAIDAVNIYATVTTEGASGSVIKAPLAGGPIVELVTGIKPPMDIANDATSVYWTIIGDTNQDNGAVMRAPIAGGAATAIATGQSSPSRVAVDADNVYWHEQGTSVIWKVSKGGGAPVQLVYPIQAAAMAVEAGWLYLSTGAGLSKVLVAGGTPTVLCTGIALTPQIALDADRVWSGHIGTIEAQFKDGVVLSVLK